MKNSSPQFARATRVTVLALVVLISVAVVAAEHRLDDPKPGVSAGTWVDRPIRNKELAAIMSVIERGWRTRLEAGLDRNRGQEQRFEKELERFYSTRTPVQVAADDARSRGEEPKAAALQINMMSFNPLQPTRYADENTSELAKQTSYIQTGRENEDAGNFRVLDFGVDEMRLINYQINDQSAKVVVDISFWTLFHFNDGTNEATSRPSGTDRHTFELRREDGDWKIVYDDFEVLPGSEP